MIQGTIQRSPVAGEEGEIFPHLRNLRHRWIGFRAEKALDRRHQSRLRAKLLREAQQAAMLKRLD